MMIIKNVAQETTEETLKSTFEGAVTARIAKDTGVSRAGVWLCGPEVCKAVMEAISDLHIDGNKVIQVFDGPWKKVPEFNTNFQGKPGFQRGSGGRGKGRGRGIRGGRDRGAGLTK